MNIFELRSDPYVMSTFEKVSLALIAAILLWATGLPLLLQKAEAAALTSISDTLSTSDISALAKHTIAFTNATSTSAGQTIKIQLDPTGSLFSQSFSPATTTLDDITTTGMDIVDVCSGNPSEVTVVGNYNNGTDENLTFTVCANDTVPAGTITVTVGSSTGLWTNPGTAGSYEINIGGTQDNSGETRVYVLSSVTMTAAVNSSFSFTVTGLSTTTALTNYATTTKTSTSTAIPFGELASGTPQVIGQQLSVSTNARNGFVVTVQENQNLLSSTGADIDLFIEGATTSSPVQWVAPTPTLDQEHSYGHIGVTSDDSDLNSGEFLGTKYAGNFNTARAVFSHTGPADGTTQDKGMAKVAFKIEITDLQEAGSDYTNVLTYVATPTF